MSITPGERLGSLLEREFQLRPNLRRSLPHALVEAMNHLWSQGELHGDLTFDNILCKLPNKDSLVR